MRWTGDKKTPPALEADLLVAQRWHQMATGAGTAHGGAGIQGDDSWE